MKKHNLILIGGSGMFGKHLITTCCNKIDLIETNVTQTKISDFKTEKTFLIERMPPLKEPFWDPKESVFNYQKHKISCLKNRKARKKKKRSKY